ncbi:hypothetical protein VTN00DRAFT_8350 [Thermoascus crustaceus]|uniref:uncharacterized protein n=1 Tax=Thermoascus crustaceus TaxID=5088 RepID=UPI003744658F
MLCPNPGSAACYPFTLEYALKSLDVVPAEERDTPDATATAPGGHGEVEESGTEAGTPSTATLNFENDSTYTFANLSFRDNVGDGDGYHQDNDGDEDTHSVSYENISVPTLPSAGYDDEAAELNEYEYSLTYQSASDEHRLWDSESNEFDEYRQARVPKTGTFPDCWECEKELDEFPPTVCNEWVAELDKVCKCDMKFTGPKIFRRIWGFDNAVESYQIIYF